MGTAQPSEARMGNGRYTAQQLGLVRVSTQNTLVSAAPVSASDKRI